jgi:hypothetical protein
MTRVVSLVSAHLISPRLLARTAFFAALLVGCDKTSGSSDPAATGASSSTSKRAPEHKGTASAATTATPTSTPGALPCATGGGTVSDGLSAPFFPRASGAYCIDPNAEVVTYGEKGKRSMDEVCTTAFDGECEIYKQFGLKRVVVVHYADGRGKGGNVEIVLSRFGDPQGAIAMFTKRTVASHPLEEGTPKPLAAGVVGSIGTGRAYVVRGTYLVELQYNNETESPEELSKSSAEILSALGKAVGDKLPGSASDVPGLQKLPSEDRVPSGLLVQPKDALGLKNLGLGVIGFYKGKKEYQLAILARDSEEQAKDSYKVLKTRPGAKDFPGLPGVFDEALTVDIVGSADSPKVEWVFARKGPIVAGAGTDPHALRGKAAAEQPKLLMSKEELRDEVRRVLMIEADLKSPGKGAPSGSATAKENHK